MKVYAASFMVQKQSGMFLHLVWGCVAGSEAEAYDRAVQRLHVFLTELGEDNPIKYNILVQEVPDQWVSDFIKEQKSVWKPNVLVESERSKEASENESEDEVPVDELWLDSFDGVDLDPR